MSNPKERKWAGNGALRIIYNHFNKEYFGGKLIVPEKLQFVPNLSDDGHTSYRSSGTVWVSIHNDLRKHLDMASIVLLHEMVHVFLGYDYQGQHGMRFQSEIHRLFLAGAYDKVI